jgi:hypothetical protein
MEGLLLGLKNQIHLVDQRIDRAIFCHMMR